MKLRLLVFTLLLCLTAAGQSVTWTPTYTQPVNGTPNSPTDPWWMNAVYDATSAKTVWYLAPAGYTGIYSTHWYWYDSAGTHGFFDFGGTSSSGDACPSALDVPRDRHPFSNIVVDNVHHTLYMFSGINVGCFDNPLADMYAMHLNSNPASNSWTKLTLAHFPDTTGYGSTVYDPDDDVIVNYGGNSGGFARLWAYCDTHGTGSLSSKQAVVCGSTHDDWLQLTPVNAPTVSGFNIATYLTLVYDTVTHKVLMYSGLSGNFSVTSNNVYALDVPTSTWAQKCLSCSTVPPIYNGTAGPIGDITYSTVDHKLYYHQGVNTGAPGFWAYDPVADNWSQLTSTGLTKTGEGVMVHDPSTNKLILWSKDATSGGLVMFEGQLSGPALSVPLTIRETLPVGAPGCSSAGACGVARTNEPFRMGVPLPDSSTLGASATSTLGLTGCSSGQFRPLATYADGNLKWVEVSGIVPSLTAGGTATCTLVGTGSGNFPASNMATDNGATITVATGTATFTIKKANFNVINVASVGATALVTSSSAATRGVTVTGPVYPNTDCTGGCTTAYSSANDGSSTVVIEENGPVEVVLKATGALVDSLGNTYLRYTVREHFWQNKNSVKLHVELRNADAPASSFATAFKAYAGWEIHMDLATGAGNSYSFGGRSGVVGPTAFSGSENATLVQLYGNSKEDTAAVGDFGIWDTANLPENSTQTIIPRSSGGSCSPDIYCYPNDTRTAEGYTIKDGATTLESGNRSQYPAGWADVANGSGTGVQIGVWYLAANWPKSLELNAGGGNTVIGLRPQHTSGFNWWLCYGCYEIEDAFLTFHASAISSEADTFNSLQYDLMGSAPVAQYNATNAFLVGPLPEPADEDAYYTAIGAAANPIVSSSVMCCVTDTPQNYTGGPYNTRVYAWNGPGGTNQLDIRLAYLIQYETRGFTSKYLQSKMFNRFVERGVLPRSDFSGGFRGQSSSLLSAWGIPRGVTSANATAAYQPWSNIDELHFHVYDLPLWYYTSGEEHYKDAVTQGVYDWTINTASLKNSPSATAGYPATTRSTGIDLMFAARVFEFAKGVGDPVDAATGLLVSAEAVTTAENILDKTVRANLITQRACTRSDCTGSGDVGQDQRRGVQYCCSNYQGWNLYTTETFGTGNGTTTTFTHTMAAPRLPLENGWFGTTPTFQIQAGAVVATDDAFGVGTLSGTGVTSGSINYSTGAATITFASAPTNGQVISVFYYYPVSAAESPSGVIGSIRPSSPFQHNLLLRGMREYLDSQGSSYANVESVSDQMYGIAWNYIHDEMTVDSGTGIWTNDGLRFGEAIDFCNNTASPCNSDPIHNNWPIGGSQAIWDNWAWLHSYYGSQSWLSTFKANLFRVLVGVSTPPNGMSEYATYGLSNLVWHALNIDAYKALVDMSITNFTDLGSGSYRVQWTVPSSAVAYKFKWGSKAIHQGLAFDNADTGTYGLDPATNQTWFSAANVADEPAPATPGTSQTYTFVTGTTGLSSANFSIKAQQTPQCAVSSTVTSPSSVGQTVSWTFTAAGCGGGTLTWSVTGSLPPGASGCSSTTGNSCTVSGTLTTAGTYTPTVHTSDGGANSASTSVTEVVNAPAGTTFGGVAGSRTVSGVTTIKH